VAFSCKNRGLCPSCAGRRMAAQAAHLVDCVLPAVPIRQFVLSFPPLRVSRSASFELSLLAASKPEVLRALARIHAEELARYYKAAAKKSGETGKLHAGAVTFVQRFGSSLNLHVHLGLAPVLWTPEMARDELAGRCSWSRRRSGSGGTSRPSTGRKSCASFGRAGRRPDRSRGTW